MSSKNKLVLLFSVFIFTAACLTAGCGGKTAKAGKFKIGVIVSLSGTAAPLGQSEKRSIELLGKQLGEKGIDGTPVEFLIEDDESDPAKANIAANKLINQEKVCAIVGCSTTGSTLAIASTIEKASIPLVAMAAGTKVTDPVKKWIFSVAPGDSLVIQRVMIYFKDELKIKKFAILHDANAYGTGGADEVKAQAPKYNLSITANESYGSADTDMTAQLSKIQQTEAEAILVWGTNPGPASIARNMQQLGIKVPFVGSSGIASQKFIDLAGPAAEGATFPASRLILPSTIPAGSEWEKTVTRFNQEYKSAYNMNIDTFAAHGWDASNIVVNAIRKVGEEPDAIRLEIQNLKEWPGADGVFTYSATDHAGLKVDALVMVKVENGKWAQARP